MILEKINNFFLTKPGKIILVIISLSLIIGVGVLFWNNILNKPNSIESIKQEEDPSGLSVISTNAEPEGNDDNSLIIGYQIFYDTGFSSSQQTKIYNSTLQYFKENYPNIKRISYKANSLYYPDSSDNSKTSFIVVTDDNQSFRVNLNTNNSYTDIDVTFSKN